MLGGYWVLFGPPWPFTAALTAGVLVTFMLYTRRFMWPMRQFGQVLDSYQYAEAASQRILGLIEDPRRIPEPEDAHDLGTVRGSVEYDGVSFRYSEGEQVLRDVSFTVERGSHEDLLARDGLYANLWSVQVGEVEDLPEEFVRRTKRGESVPGDTD